MNLSYRNIQDNDIEIICNFPTSEEELFYMYPKAHFPLDKAQLSDAISQRKDSIVVICNDRPVAFANFYEVEPCTRGSYFVL